MKLAAEFPSVVHREGPAAISRLAAGIEAIGYDQLEIFDHVAMGHPIEGRPPQPYPANMPLLEALMTLAYAAAATSTIGLGTEVLVLPQRHPTLVAKQVSTLDTLSGGRVRLGIGVGWQESEYDALGMPFHQRGRMMDEAIAFLRAWWGDASVDFDGDFFQARAMAMEPKPPQGASIPIWVGGASPAALRRAGTVADGWLASAGMGDSGALAGMIERVKEHAAAAGRDPSSLGFQAQLSPPPRSDDPGGRNFYRRPDDVVAVALAAKSAGFDAAAINVTGVFLAGARRVDAMIEALGTLHDRLRAELGSD